MSTARRLGAPPANLVMRGLIGARTARWPAYSRLFAVGDLGRWSVDEDAEQLAAAARRLGCRVAPSGWARFATRQSVFLSSHFDALHPRWLDTSHRLATAYLHGRPGTPGAPEFDECFERLRSNPDRIARIQVTHEEMHELVLSAGVSPERVFRIPIGIDLEHFPLGDADAKAQARATLGLPAQAFVVGSFQKDGVGWDEGLEPKLVKGPDILVDALARLRVDAPDLHVVLTGPARGYVRRELEQRGIPYRHLVASTRGELARAYVALDAYLVTSRQEGGPKAVLEAMATGTPLVTTRVGQAQDIVEARAERASRRRRRRRSACCSCRSHPDGLRARRGASCRRSRDCRTLRVRAARRPLGRASRRLRRAERPVTRRLTPRRVVRGVGRRVPRRPFRFLMPSFVWRPLFRFWLSVVASGSDRRESVRDLLIAYDDVYGQLDRAAIAYDDGVHAKHRLTRYHDFFVERVEPGERVLDVGSGKGELAYDLVVRSGAEVVGIDHDPAHLEFARARFVHDRLEFVGGDALERLSGGPLRRRRPLERARAPRAARRVPPFAVASAAPRRVLIRVPTYARDWTVPLKEEVGLLSSLGPGSRGRVRPGRASAPSSRTRASRSAR